MVFLYKTLKYHLQKASDWYNGLQWWQAFICWLLIPVAIILFLVVPVVSNMRHSREQKIQHVLSEYPLIDVHPNIKAGMKSVVSEIKVGADVLNITLDTGRKFSLQTDTYNYQCKPKYLFQFIQVGDSVYKPEEDILFYVIRGRKKYPFQLRERLNIKIIDIDKTKDQDL